MTMTEETQGPKYPNIKVLLTGKDGNAFAVLGAVSKALRNGGVSKVEVHQFMTEATSGDYDHLLQTCIEWADVR